MSSRGVTAKRPGFAEAVAARESLSKVHLFKGCSDRFLEVLAEQVLHEIIQPGVDIVKEGDHGDCMYVLTRGEADVLIGDTVIATLGDGTIFGEMAALCRNRSLARRTATVRSKTLCDCRVTSRKVVLQTAQNFPKDANIIQKEVDRRIAELKIDGHLKDARQWQPLRAHLGARTPEYDRSRSKSSRVSAHSLEARTPRSRSKASSRVSVHSPVEGESNAGHFYRARLESGSPEFDRSRSKASSRVSVHSPDAHESAAGHLPSTQRDSDATPRDLVDGGESGLHPPSEQDSARPDSQGRVHFKQAPLSHQQGDRSYVTSDALLALALPGIALTRARQTHADQDDRWTSKKGAYTDREGQKGSMREFLVGRLGPEHEHERAFAFPLPKPPMSARGARLKAHPLSQDMSLPAGGAPVRITKKGAARAKLGATRVSCSVAATPQAARQADGGGRQFQKPTVCSRASSTKVWQQLDRSQGSAAWQRVVPKARDIPSQGLVHETETLWQRYQRDRA